MNSNGHEKYIRTNSLVQNEEEGRSGSLSIGGLLKMAKRSCDIEVVETSRQNTARLSGSVKDAFQRQRRSITQLEIQKIINDHDQWEKLKQTMRNRNATTGMKLRQELPALLQEQLKDIPKCDDDTCKRKAGLVPNLQHRVSVTVNRRLCTLQNETVGANQHSASRLVNLSESRKGADGFGGPSMDPFYLLQILDVASNTSDELAFDDSSNFDRAKPKNQIMSSVA